MSAEKEYLLKVIQVINKQNKRNHSEMERYLSEANCWFEA